MTLGSNYKFVVLLGRISSLMQTSQVIYKNDAIDVSFPKKRPRGQQRSLELKNRENRSNFNLFPKVEILYIVENVCAAKFWVTHLRGA